MIEDLTRVFRKRKRILLLGFAQELKANVYMEIFYWYCANRYVCLVFTLLNNKTRANTKAYKIKHNTNDQKQTKLNITQMIESKQN